MNVLAGFDCYPLHFDDNGNTTDPGELKALAGAVQAQPGAEVILISHGFRNNEVDAGELYRKFLEGFATHRNGTFAPKLGSRHFVVGAVYWPSKPFREETDGAAQAVDGDAAIKQALLMQLDDLKSLATTPEQHAALDRAKTLLDAAQTSNEAQDEFANCVRTLIPSDTKDATEGDGRFFAMSGSEMIGKLGAGPIVVPTVRASDDDEGGAQSIAFAPTDDDGGSGGVEGIGSFFGSVFGHIGHFLNIALWYVMKSRSGTVGLNGVAPVCRALRALQPAPKIHLVGHSLGARVMASCAKTLAQDPLVHVDSMTLLEAAFSHYGFSGDNGHGSAGFFRDVVTKKVVAGPFICTYSVKDTVVGLAYALTSRIADDNARAIGDENDQYGGLGRNGVLKTEGVAEKTDLRQDGSAEYVFSPGRIFSLDGSNGLIGDHGDVTNPAVTFAFSCAMSQS